MPTRPSSRGTNGSLRLVRVLCSCRPTVGSAPGQDRGTNAYPTRGYSRTAAPAGGATPSAPREEAGAVGGLGGAPAPLGRQAEGGGQVGRHLAGQVAEARPGAEHGPVRGGRGPGGGR